MASDTDSGDSILYTALFGVFGRTCIGRDSQCSVRIMNSVWVDLANLLLWLITAIYGLAFFLRYRDTRSLFTGRAKV